MPRRHRATKEESEQRGVRCPHKLELPSDEAALVANGLDLVVVLAALDAPVPPLLKLAELIGSVFTEIEAVDFEGRRGEPGGIGEANPEAVVVMDQEFGLKAGVTNATKTFFLAATQPQNW